MIEELAFLQVVDLSIREPLGESEVVYSRIFGRGKDNLYQFSDDEISSLHAQAHRETCKNTFMVFHTLGKYTDAIRMQVYESTGKFLPISNTLGVNSAMTVLGPGVIPAWRRDLVDNHGWKLCDWTDGKRVRLGYLLGKIPERLFRDSAELRGFGQGSTIESIVII